MKGLITFLCGLFFTVTAFSQATIRGTVTDAEGLALPGVTVIVKGTLNGTSTGGDGNYSIDAAPEATLVFSSIGYVTQEIPVGNQRTINLTMQEDVKLIEEVVVVGYGVMRKSDVTGAVLSVSSEKLRDRPVINAMEALQGKAAGVDITNNVRPGELGDIRIRGERSITGGNNPLYVVDGIPIFGRNNINSINTQDINSFSFPIPFTTVGQTLQQRVVVGW